MNINTILYNEFFKHSIFFQKLSELALAGTLLFNTRGKQFLDFVLHQFNFLKPHSSPIRG